MVDIGAESAARLADRTPVSVSWPAVFGGAVCGAGLAFVLDAFGAAIGLAVSSTAPTWRDASFALVFLSGIYLILTAILSYGLGAYLAARIRERFSDLAEEREIRDGVQGLIVWGAMTLATALMVTLGASGLSHLSGQSPGSSDASTSVAGENIVAFDLDRLFRGTNRPVSIPYQYVRAEAARILLTTSSHRGMLDEDRTYLVGLVERTTGLPATEAQTRVNNVNASARQNIDRARNSAVIMAFMIAAAALLGAVAAWFAAAAGGRQRDGIQAAWPGAEWRAPSIRF
jgi:hypothetical protein